MKYFLLLLAMVPSLSFAARSEGHENGNAGDVYAIEFKLTARDVAQRLRMLPVSELRGIDLHLLTKTIRETTVSSSEHLFLRGVEVNAVNQPEKKLITVNRTWWKPLREVSETQNRLRLVMHEYLWVIGVQDEGFVVSERLTALLNVKNYDPNTWWNPLNPVNHLSLNLATKAPGCELQAMEFDTLEKEELTSTETSSACDQANWRKVVVLKSSYDAPADSGAKGLVHSYEVSVLDRQNQVLGKLSFEPEWGNCIALDDANCRASGRLRVGGVNIQFSFLREVDPTFDHD